jgi:hypothetical protein
MSALPKALAGAIASDDVQVGGRALAPDGIWEVIVTQCNLDMPTKDGKNRKAQWVFEIVGGQKTEDGTLVPTARMWYDASHLEAAYGLLKAPFVAMGLPTTAEADEFVGETCLADVRQDEFKGRKNNKIVRLLAKDGATANRPKAGTKDDPWG